MSQVLELCCNNHLNLDEIDWLHESGRSGENASVQAPPGGGNDLAASPVDGISVQSNVIDVEANATHVLVAEDTLKDR